MQNIQNSHASLSVGVKFSTVLVVERSRADPPSRKFQPQISLEVPLVNQHDFTLDGQSVAEPVSQVFLAKATSPFDAVGSDSVLAS